MLWLTSRQPTRRWAVWSAALVLTILLHALVLKWWPHFQAPEIKLPPRVDLQMIDPAKLAAIKKQWTGEKALPPRQRQKSAQGKIKAPSDARYISDRNIHVEKEQRARETNVIPKLGRPGPAAPLS